MFHPHLVRLFFRAE